MKDKVLISVHEISSIDEIAKRASEEREAIKDLDFLLQSHWRQTPYDFDASIKMMETALKFDCLETAENIKQDLRRSNPYSWAAYAQSHHSDHSGASNQDNR